MHFSNNVFCLAVLSAFRSLKNGAVFCMCCTIPMTFKSISARKFIVEGVSQLFQKPLYAEVCSVCMYSRDCFRTVVRVGDKWGCSNRLVCKSIVLSQRCMNFGGSKHKFRQIIEMHNYKLFFFFFFQQILGYYFSIFVTLGLITSMCCPQLNKAA